MPKKKLTASFISSVNVDKQTEFYDKNTSGLGLRVSPGGTKTFFYRYRFNGKNRRYSIDQYSRVYGLADARKRVDELRSYVKDGGDPVGDAKAKKNNLPETFKGVIEAYKKKHLPTLKDSTRTDYEYRIKHLIQGEGKDKVKGRGFDGDRYIKDMKRYEVIDFLEEIAKEAPTQAQRIQAILSGIFKFSKNREWVDTNIANEISLKAKKSKKSKRQNVNLNNDQVKKLWYAFDSHSEPVGSIFKMLLLLGQRAGETRLMKWENVDLKKQLWTIPSSDTKNGLVHYVPLTEMALEIIETLKPWASGKFVFESPVNKGKPIGSQQKAAQRIRKDTEVKDFNIHSLRTTAATRLAMLGTSPQVLSKILNHKKPGEGSLITAIYNKYDYEKEKRIALNKWHNHLNEILTGKTSNILEIGA